MFSTIVTVPARKLTVQRLGLAYCCHARAKLKAEVTYV